MSKKCDIKIEKHMITGNSVSHANNKTRKVFYINIKKYRFISKALNKYIKIKTTPSAVRNIVKCKGLDNFLINRRKILLNNKSIIIKNKIEKKIISKYVYKINNKSNIKKY